MSGIRIFLLAVLIGIITVLGMMAGYDETIKESKLTIDSLTAVIAVKNRSYDSLLTEHSLSNARQLKAFVKQLKHSKKLGAEISGRRK